MSRSPQPRTFLVPPAATGPSVAATKPNREPGPFVVVPTAFVGDDRDQLEPHWLPTIDAATD